MKRGPKPARNCRIGVAVGAINCYNGEFYLNSDIAHLKLFLGLAVLLQLFSELTGKEMTVGCLWQADT